MAFGWKSFINRLCPAAPTAPTFSTDNMHGQEQSIFFLLPAEIRMQIYQYTVEFRDLDFCERKSPASTLLTSELSKVTERGTRKSLGLVRSCKRIYLEFEPIEVSRAAFRYRERGGVGYSAFAIRGARDWDGVKVFSISIESEEPAYYQWLAFVKIAIDRMTSLKELCIEWHCRNCDPLVLPFLHAAQYEQVFMSQLERSLGEKPSLKTIRFRGAQRPPWIDNLMSQRQARQSDDSLTSNEEPPRAWPEVTLDSRPIKNAKPAPRGIRAYVS